MNTSNIKGALLEYIVRNLLFSCGFTNVKSDGLYSFERSGLFFVNGKGAAHDMDIIMNPPIQMPFTYPTQLIFECKANRLRANLPMVRNALGLRNDINEFEIVTKDSLKKRPNNRRASYAIETRTRFLYQVGVASINGFSKPAIEFATNNKIPLFSLSWFLGEDAVNNFNNNIPPLIDSLTEQERKILYKFLKDRESKLEDNEINDQISNIINTDNGIAKIISSANSAMNNAYVGLLETGDLVFLYTQSNLEDNILNKSNGLTSLKAELHWNVDDPIKWRLTIINSKEETQRTDFDFYLPIRIFNYWKQFYLNKNVALNMKQEFFSRIFIFNKRNIPEAHFSIINIDKKWLENVRNDLDNEIKE